MSCNCWWNVDSLLYARNKNQSKIWTGPGESAPKKAKTVPSAGKVMATTFWDSHSIILIDYLQQGKHITGEYYASLLDRSDAILKEKRLHLAKKSAFPPRQCTSSHECHCNGQVIWFTLRNTSSSTLFPRFNSFRLFFVSWHENLAWR